MRTETPTAIYLKDYQPSNFLVTTVDLRFSLFEDGAEVVAVTQFSRNNDESSPRCSELKLNGEELSLKGLKLDGRTLSEDEYSVSDEGLVIPNVPQDFTLECVTWIEPQNNKRLEGLYKSSSMFCTQCEAEGFRRITYYLDRPDVMATFTTRIEADKARYPVLLSNGNKIDEGDLSDGRHFATWEDPHKKPCYLFALVAGDLHCHAGTFVRKSGKPVDLKIFVDHKNSAKCEYAMDALQRSMRWDEEAYGREYDLDIFMIVAVDDFNMGAMENKGLNIFNSSCVLASPDTTTDNAYLRIEAIVAHEYFHNWSGNRVTCRDWFQLSLKEGFTVYRDAQFSADMNSEGVKRIDDVNLLRTLQFAEDGGPMSHSVRPESYMEISNFYTLTIYEKGAEVVGMLHTLLGDSKFREGSDLYFDRHDGQAVTTDDFVAAMEDVSGRDLTQFKRWYDQAGTPVVNVTSSFDESSQTFALTFQQSCPDTPRQKNKKPFHIPVSLSLFDANGQPLSLSSPDRSDMQGQEYLLELTQETETIRFENISRPPVPSLLRGFSAPVKLEYAYSEDDLAVLFMHDTDSFNRWDAGQRMALGELDRLISAKKNDGEVKVSERFVQSYHSVLKQAVSEGERADKAMLCKLMMLPSVSYLIERSNEADVHAIYSVREYLKAELASACRGELEQLVSANVSASGDDLSYGAMSTRGLMSASLAMLAAVEDESSIKLACERYDAAKNMTEASAALSTIVNSAPKDLSQGLLASFYERWKDDAQVIEQWLSMQASSCHFMDLEGVKQLTKHESFDITNPNKVRSVVGAFCGQNFIHFHHQSGEGYEFLADTVIELDALNPQIAARLVTPLTRWRKFNPLSQDLMVQQLRRISGQKTLSKDLSEVVHKSLPEAS